MIVKKLFMLFVLVFSVSCITGQKKELENQKPVKKAISSLPNIKKSKKKVDNNTVKQAVLRTKNYANSLVFNIDAIRQKGQPDKKYLAEYLGLFLKLKKYNKIISDNEIKQKLTPIYQKIQEKEFHNMATVDAKLFKKNSMSYMRIMWILDQLGYDISHYKKEFFTIKKRMDDHMKLRGEWQRAVFDKYYDYFKLSKPIELKYAKKLKGSIAYQKPIDYYNRTNAYILTHFIFASYDYGNALTQSRFDQEDLAYLKEILPQIITKFEAKNNDDIVGELLTCQVLIGDTNSDKFKQSFDRLLRRQNQDGSFGGYEKYRKKIGNDVEYRAYLHTTLVDIEMFIEDAFRKNKMLKK